MDLDALFKRHPAPWTHDRDRNSVIDGNGMLVTWDSMWWKQLSDAVNRIHELTKERDQIRASLSSRDKELEAWRQQDSDSRRKLKVEKENVSRMNGSLASLENICNQRQAENERLKGELDAASKAYTESTSRLTADNERLQSAVHELEETVSEVEDDKNELRRQRERLKAKVEELEHALSDKVIAWTGVRKAQSDAEDMHRHLNSREQRRFAAACAFAASGKDTQQCIGLADKLLSALYPETPAEPEPFVHRHCMPYPHPDDEEPQRNEPETPAEPTVDSISPDSFSRKPAEPPENTASCNQCGESVSRNCGCPPEPPKEEWRIDDYASNLDYMISNGKERFRLGGVDRDFAWRIVRLLNGDANREEG